MPSDVVYLVVGVGAFALFWALLVALDERVLDRRR